MNRLGPRIRALRRQHGLTQARLAQELGISASYLNLIEHERRPVSARVLIKLAQRFDLDLSAFDPAQDQELIEGLREALVDPVFQGADVPLSAVRDLAATSPELARAFLTLYEAFRRVRQDARELAERVADASVQLKVEPFRLPSEEVSDVIQDHLNHFPELEAGAEELVGRLNLRRGAIFEGLRGYLEKELGIEVRLIAGQEDWAVRRFDPERGVLRLSERLPPRSANFQLAHQVGLLTMGDVIDRIVDEAPLSSEAARTLCRVALANYFAGAVLMPYRPFLQAARELRYDIELLGSRFRTSFEQVCHRLTTLQRQGERGIPFHLIRVDIAGNISKRFSASGIRFARFSGACPRWNVHAAFLTPGMIRVQVSKMFEGPTYFCVARTVRKGSGPFGQPQTIHAIGLGCRVEQAMPREGGRSPIVYADGVDLSDDHAVPVGVSCRLCQREDCEQRAFPPLAHPLHIDANVRGRTFYYAPQQEEG